MNARPCQHCGFGKHWDYKCKYSQKGERQAQANYASLLDPDEEALNAYDNLYYELESGDESENDLQHFRSPSHFTDHIMGVIGGAHL